MTYLNRRNPPCQQSSNQTRLVKTVNFCLVDVSRLSLPVHPRRKLKPHNRWHAHTPLIYPCTSRTTMDSSGWFVFTGVDANQIIHIFVLSRIDLILKFRCSPYNVSIRAGTVNPCLGIEPNIFGFPSVASRFATTLRLEF
jgi:hypothetical protein